MAVLLITAGSVIGLVLLSLAVIGARALLKFFLSGRDTRALLARQAHQAEADIAEISRRAQEAIITEALGRFGPRRRDW
jgi:hypothetical protein